MKLSGKRIMSVVLVLLLSMTLVIPVSAAKPQKNDLGLLQIATSANDANLYLAVCISEEDGNYVYSGQHPIQQQAGLYVTVTNSLEYNSVYQLEEDTEFDAIKGVYRFALKEKVQSGSSGDVFRPMAEVKKNENVYFVHLDMNESDVFVTEKTTVSSVRKGVLTTKDKLEDQFGNGEFAVIFNDNGNVVGFCKAGEAVATASSNTGGGLAIIMPLLIGFVIGTLIWLLRKKKKAAPPAPDFDGTDWDDDRTTLDSDTGMNDFDDGFDNGFGNAFALKCHGGYLNGRVYPVPADGITIGREPDNTIRYPAQTPGISRHHVKLFWQNGQLMLVDLGSSNGTYYNQSGRLPQMRPVPLKPGDVFYLGEKLNGFEVICK